MAKRIYERKDGQGTIAYWDNPLELSPADIQAEIDWLTELNGLSDEALGALSLQCANLPDRDQIQEEIDKNLDLLDYFSYQKTDVVLSTADGDWFIPEAVESFCGEEAGNEAILAIDGQNNTFWQHETDETHEIVFRLRSYRKRVSKFRIRRNTNARSELTGLDIYVANSIGGLDRPENLAIAGVDLVTPSGWNEFDFDTKQGGKYCRLTGFQSANTNNQVRIRQIEFWVETFPLE